MAAAMKKRGPGRPRALTAQKRRDFLELMRAGALITSACDAAGISYSALKRYLSEGSEAFDAQFAREVDAAKHASLRAAFRTVMRAAKKDWRAALAIIRAHETGSYSKHVRTETTLTTRHEIDASLKLSAEIRSDRVLSGKLLDQVVEMAKADKIALPAASDREMVTSDG